MLGLYCFVISTSYLFSKNIVCNFLQNTIYTILSFCFMMILHYSKMTFQSVILFSRLPEEEDDQQMVRCTSALANSRAAYEKLRQRAVVLKVARDQGWHVAKELASLQDQEEDPLLKKAIKNAARR